ncbi:unnamed protein product [Linum trigynum]|uniref:Uncharacterized protein n=2 Tax=Linum trigynum TaxID=586398 RepID=A0AAV2EX40_9ROSI
MAKFNCFSKMCGHRHKGGKVSSKALEFNKALTNLQVRVEKPFKSDDETKMASCNLSVPHDVQYDSLNVKVMMTHETAGEKEEASYEGGDEHEENVSFRRDLSDLDLQSRLPNSGEEEEELIPTPRSQTLVHSHSVEDVIDLGRSGHISDPGIGKAPFWGSPKLKRSCSNLETSKVMRQVANSPCSGESQELPANFWSGSPPVSVASRHSADRVMLRKHSSSQILPSRSRRLWWKLFLWSHRNLHKPSTAKPEQFAAASNQPGGGYSSDTLEPSKGQSRAESSHKNHINHEVGKHNWDGFQNHWVANTFSVDSSSPLARVDKWVHNIDIEPLPENHHDDVDDGIVYPPSPEDHRFQVAHVSEDILHANGVILSLNSSSTVAHISGTGLKVIPSLAPFTSLRTVNLANNYIVSITPGSLPKGLHALNLSRNRINAVEGLRELTRLRVLDLSYNRISRIGQGLSNCTLIKELYLAGNKISDVEGLHRLLKLTVLDLSFNKITTSKALGQLVANYSSLQALNLLGNPIQTNIGDDQLRKAVYDLLPKLKYLNKQSIKPQRARELATDSVARAALGSSSSRGFHRRRSTRRATDSAGSSSSPVGRRSMATSGGGGQRSKSIGKSRAHISNGRAVTSSTPASSFRSRA